MYQYNTSTPSSGRHRGNKASHSPADHADICNVGLLFKFWVRMYHKLLFSGLEEIALR